MFTPKAQGILKKLSEFQLEFLDFVSAPSAIAEVPSQNQTEEKKDAFTINDRLGENISSVISARNEPMYAREIKSVLAEKGINTVSVDTTCARMRQKGELIFFPDAPNSPRGKYGLPGQSVEPTEMPIDPLLVLVQDLASATEIIRFTDYQVYRRPSPTTDADYFAPYFTRNSGKREGISEIAKICGVLYFHPRDWESFQEQIRAFAPNELTYSTWIAGLRFSPETDREALHSHYFLCPLALQFKQPLLKDPGRGEGSGKDWITLMIPANRVMPLETLFSRIPY